MVQHPKKKAAQHILAASVLAVGVAGAAYAAKHEAIVLKDPAGLVIGKDVAADTAFSMKTTCFTGGCHNNGAVIPNADKIKSTDFTYNEIEAHSYHATVGSNQIFGFNPYTPDGGDWRAGAGPMGKNWVQSPGHVGSW